MPDHSKVGVVVIALVAMTHLVEVEMVSSDELFAIDSALRMAEASSLGEPAAQACGDTGATQFGLPTARGPESPHDSIDLADIEDLGGAESTVPTPLELSGWGRNSVSVTSLCSQVLAIAIPRPWCSARSPCSASVCGTMILLHGRNGAKCNSTSN